MSKHEISPGLEVQNISVPLTLRDFRFISFDMDATLVTTECVDEIAAMIGKRDEVSAITEATMQGVIPDFKESLRQRVKLLKGVQIAQLQQVYDQRVRLSEGANELVQACRRAGLKTLLVSGGFSFFANRIRNKLQLDFVRSNVLDEENGVLTGELVTQEWGDICDGAEKRRTVLELISLMGISAKQVIAVGDGANDLPMMQAAGLSVAYHAKPRVRAQANIAINSGGLNRLLEVVKE